MVGRQERQIGCQGDRIGLGGRQQRRFERKGRRVGRKGGGLRGRRKD
jgi:hypothetical protein